MKSKCAVLVVAAVAFGCGGDGSDGTAAASVSSGVTASSSSGVGGSSTTGAGGGAATGSSGAGGDLDPWSTECTDFPVTVTLGDTTQPGAKGAILCFYDDGLLSQGCRLTTDTDNFSGNPCPSSNDNIELFELYGGMNVMSLAPSWTVLSTTGGVILDPPSYVSDIPTGVPVTLVARGPMSSVEYTVVFEFEGGGGFTITSFGPS